MKKLLMSIFLGMGILVGSAAAQTDGPDSFLIQVNPSTIQQNAPADITITAMKNGSQYLYYTGDIFLVIDELSSREYTLPNVGWYQFIPSDQGKKTLSKGLEIRKEGEFTIRATNYNDSIQGELKIKVVNALSSPGAKTITISTPQQNSTVYEENIMMSARSLDLPNSPAQIYLNDRVVKEISSDAEGNIDASLVGLKQGNNTLEVVITSVGGEELGRSELVTFAYPPLGSNLFKSIKTTPNTGILLGDTVVFDVTTDPLVSSALIIFNGGERLPIDKVSDGKFSKSSLMLATGEQVLSVEMTALGEKQIASGVHTLFVDQDTIISNVTFKLDTQTMKDLEVSWSILGKPASLFELKYGTTKEALDKTLETDRKSVIFTSIDKTKHRYFQITPLFGTEKTHGTASDIYDWVSPFDELGVSEPSDGESLSGSVIVDPEKRVSLCSVKGIRVTTQRIGGKYYLVWGAVPEAISYTVYMAETPTPLQKTKLIETAETRYEYPFDLSSEEDIFAYFRVEATCDDGQVLQLASAKKVQVGPAENLLLLVCLSLLIYAGIRLYRYTE